MKPLLLRLYRVAIVVFLVLLIHAQFRWFEAQRGISISLEQAQKYFPNAARVQARDTERGFQYALDNDGNAVGVLLTTSPETDSIIGYSGPNNVLIALATNGAIAGIELLRSGDTEEHVELVQRDIDFFKTFIGWNPTQSAPPKIAAVAGATLTSYAIAESIGKRLAGSSPSLRFPEPVTLAEIQSIFTNAASTRPEGRQLRVLDSTGLLLGFITRTSPEADNVSGYRGPTEALVAIAPDARTISAVRVRKTYDTPSYAEQIRDEETFLKSFEGRTVEQLAALDYKREKIEGVSGATETSFAITESLKRRFAAEARVVARPQRWKPKPRDWGLAAVVAGAMVMAFTPLRGKRWVRITWQSVLIGYVGLASGDLLSLQLFGGWASHGLGWNAAPGLVLLAAAALVVPWSTRRQLYCHQICPHGAAQQWLGALGKKFVARSRFSRWRLIHPWSSMLEYLPAALLAVALLSVTLGLGFNLSLLEPFDAWIFRAATWATATIAIVGLAASLFVPQAYCRFGCPTGALLNFIRSAGSADRWSARDTAGLAFLLAGLAVAGFTRMRSGTTSGGIETFHGLTMGTTWTVKIRGQVNDRASIQAVISNEFERAEQLTSHWRSNTPVAAFNRSPSTDPFPVPAVLSELARDCAAISSNSLGAFDITIGPLMGAWGFGPAAHRDTPPSEEQLQAIKPAVGWSKLHASADGLRKQHPALQLDLSAIVPGWANDRVAHALAQHGCTNFLVESGGELRAQGVWTIAIEHPARSCTLSNESIGTSGTYRQNWSSGDRQYSHLIDPRTLRPVTHKTVSVSVRANECGWADAWAAALNVLGVDEGLPLAEWLGLSAQFVTEKENKQLEVQTTSRWQQ